MYGSCMDAVLLHIHLVSVTHVINVHALIPCIAAYILPLFLSFLALSSLHHSTLKMFSLIFRCIIQCSLRARGCASPTPFAARGHMKRT